MKPSELLAALATGQMHGPRANRGVKWRKCCSRRHGSAEGCGLVAASVPAKSGRLVSRLVHEARA